MPIEIKTSKAYKTAEEAQEAASAAISTLPDSAGWKIDLFERDLPDQDLHDWYFSISKGRVVIWEIFDGDKPMYTLGIRRDPLKVCSNPDKLGTPAEWFYDGIFYSPAEALRLQRLVLNHRVKEIGKTIEECEFHRTGEKPYV